MYGVYLKCETCSATIGGEQVTASPEQPLSRFQGAELRKRAAQKGWVSDPTKGWYGEDYCPTCAHSVSEERAGFRTHRE